MANGNGNGRPDYAVSAKDHRNPRRWHRVGMAWNAVLRRDNPYIAIRLQSVPINFGSNLAVVMLPEPTDLTPEDDPTEVGVQGNKMANEIGER